MKKWCLNCIQANSKLGILPTPTWEDTRKTTEERSNRSRFWIIVTDLKIKDDDEDARNKTIPHEIKCCLKETGTSNIWVSPCQPKFPSYEKQWLILCFIDWGQSVSTKTSQLRLSSAAVWLAKCRWRCQLHLSSGICLLDLLKQTKKLTGKEMRKTGYYGM